MTEKILFSNLKACWWRTDKNTVSKMGRRGLRMWVATAYCNCFTCGIKSCTTIWSRLKQLQGKNHPLDKVTPHQAMIRHWNLILTLTLILGDNSTNETTTDIYQKQTVYFPIIFFTTIWFTLTFCFTKGINHICQRQTRQDYPG